MTTFTCSHGNPVRPHSPFTTDQCRVCWLVGDAKIAPARASLPCVHEGPVLESCTSCRGEQRHVRACLHPTADRDTCTRGYVSGLVQACASCPDYFPS